MRLIDADALNIYDVSPAYGMTVMGVTEEDIYDAPAIEIVRCKECRFKKKARFAKAVTCTYYAGRTHVMPEDGFCSYGKR